MSAASHRVAFACDYRSPLDDLRRAWANKELARQHLWGALDLVDAGFDVRDATVTGQGFKARVAAYSQQRRTGDIVTQSRFIRTRGASAVYAMAPGLVRSLATARRRHMLRRPIVAMVHPSSYLQGRIDPAAAGADVAVTFSSKIRSELIDAGRSQDSTRHVRWGPDLDFAPYSVGTDSGYVASVGRTLRDMNTLTAALTKTDLRANISVAPSDRPLAARTVLNTERTYGAALSILSNCSVVAIPLDTSKPAISGLAELNDALGFGKPIVMTRSPYIDIDLETAGCGIAVDDGDVEGWCAALDLLLSEPELRAAMGARGRRYAESHWNARLFGHDIVEAIGSVVGT